MSDYTPDRWCMLKFTRDGEVTYKILAGWKGGFADPDFWKLNSGCVKCIERDDFLCFEGYSGSTYYCRKSSYGMTSLSESIYNRFNRQIKETNHLMELMPEDTDFLNLKYEQSTPEIDAGP